MSSRRALLLGLGLAALCAGPFRAAAAERPLRVVTSQVAPFVLPDRDPPVGFSVDLWTELARRMGVAFEWRMVPREDLLSAVQRGDADVAIAAIAMTPEREALVDFSHPYFDSGLQILVRGGGSESEFRETLRSIPWLTIGEFFVWALLVIFVLANALWLLERRHSNDFAKPYLPAIGEGIWGTVLIIATGEHLDRNAPGVLRRLVVVAVWLAGVVLIAHLTATVTASQTAQRLQSSIQGPEELPGKAIASVPGTPAGDYLTQHGLPFVRVDNAPEALRMLRTREVQAIVFDAPTLQYWAAREGPRAVQVVGPIFRPEKYGIAVAEGSPLRKRINEALLAMYMDGAYEEIYATWFARGK